MGYDPRGQGLQIDGLIGQPITKTVSIQNPTGAVTVSVWHATEPAILILLEAKRVGGTGATVNARHNGADLHLASDMEAGDGGFALGTPLQNPGYSVGDVCEVLLTGVTGAPTEVAVQLTFTRPFSPS